MFLHGYLTSGDRLPRRRDRHHDVRRRLREERRGSMELAQENREPGAGRDHKAHQQKRIKERTQCIHWFHLLIGSIAPIGIFANLGYSPDLNGGSHDVRPRRHGGGAGGTPEFVRANLAIS